MSESTRNDRNALRRSRSAPDVPVESNRQGPAATTIANDIQNGPRSAGPSHTYSYGPGLGGGHVQEGDAVQLSSLSSPAATVPPVHHQPPAAFGTTAAMTSGPGRPIPRQYNPHRSFIYRAMVGLGYGRGASPDRKILVSLIWNLAWGFSQVATIIALLAYAAHKESPQLAGSGISEWTACSRPLGVWCCLWIGRVFVACALSFWGWKRDQTTRTLRIDTESGTTNAVQSSPNTGTAQNRNLRSSYSASNQQSGSPGAPNSQDSTPLPHSLLFRRLSLFSSLYSLSWFLTAHILVYTSVNTCRASSPHLWWLVFGILCITYLMVLEVIILGLVVFIIGPFILLIWNIVLICLGRHPLQNPHMIKPDIGKLPKSDVDRIPLVMYIPPPPDAPSIDGPIKIPDAAYSYPPKDSQVTPTPSKKRFKFIRRRFRSKKNDDGVTENGKKAGGKDDKVAKDDSWEDHWELEGYPFVVLDNNRAACAICLMDFDEPKKVKKSDAGDTVIVSGSSKKEEDVSRTDIVEVEERERDAADLKLEDAGEGAQPLRLLACGHVFHKTCLDPWLTDVSGRCPVCQRRVELPEPSKKKKKERRR